MDSTAPQQIAAGPASRGPAAGEPASQGHTAGEPASQGQSPGVSASRGRLLLIEDDPESAFFCTYVLSKRGGFDVTHVADPTLALTLVVTRPWDLVIADLELPIMSGLEFVAALRRVAPRLPVVLVTAYPHDVPTLAASQQARQPDAVLAKPVPADLLLSAATALAGPAAQDRRQPDN
jgi:CheY-like chemotaxis protein